MNSCVLMCCFVYNCEGILVGWLVFDVSIVSAGLGFNGDTIS